MPIGTMKTTVARTGSVEHKWFVVDATDQILGRLSTQIARVLMGKHKPIYTPHVDTGDYVIVTNVGKMRITGNKLDEKSYARYSYYPGGYKEVPMRDVFDSRPERVLEESVRRMLPKNALARKMLKKLKIYRDENHDHAAQQPEAWPY